MKSLLTLHFSIYALVSLMHTPDHLSAAPGPGDYGVPREVIPAPENARYEHLAWPKIVKAPDGTLVTAYIAGRQHAWVSGCPAVSISTDSGKSFSEPEILMHFDETKEYHHSGNVAMGLARDGAIVLLAMAFTKDERNTIFGWRSTDSGRSWARVDTSSLADDRTGSVFGHIFAMPDGRLAVTGHYRLPKGFGIWIAWSDDDGRSWGDPVTITNWKLFEPTFISVDDRLIGLIRNNTVHGYHQFISDDEGKTWDNSQIVLKGGNGTHPSPFLVADPENPQTLYALQSQRTERGEIYLWTADAATLDWKRHSLIATFAGIEDYTYPWMTHLKDNEWFVVFYAGDRDGPNSIYGMKIAIEPK